MAKSVAPPPLKRMEAVRWILVVRNDRSAQVEVEVPREVYDSVRVGSEVELDNRGTVIVIQR